MTRRAKRRQWTLGEHLFWALVWTDLAVCVAFVCYFSAVQR